MTGMLGAAVGVPYAMNNAPEGWEEWLPNQSPPAAVSVESAPPIPSPYGGQSPYGSLPQPGSRQPFPGEILYASSTNTLGATGFHPMEQVLRMDVNKQWVYQQWERKSTGLADPGLFGVRVPLVTGTGMNDIAGSLSYYFNEQGQVDRIRFKGTTADTNRVIGLAMHQYGLQWQTPRVPGEQLLQARAGDEVVSQLRTFPEPVLWTNKPHGSFGVEMELNRPGSGRFVDLTGPKLVVPPPAPVAAPPAAAPATAEPAAKATTASGPGPQKAKPSDVRWPD